MSQNPLLQKQASEQVSPSLKESLQKARQLLLSHRHESGFWWYTLEANDSINAEYIFLMHYLGVKEPKLENAICNWMIRNQRQDGSWALYHKGPGCVSSTVECYMALKMAGHDLQSAPMVKAREFILQNGGVTKIRIFSRIHLAIFGLIDWKHCPNMPVSLMQFPEWTPVNIYEFSSWARACIVPLLVIMDQKKVVHLKGFDIDELYVDGPQNAHWTYDHIKNKLSFENVFVQIDKALKVADKIKVKPLRSKSLKKCEEYIREHLSQTEDIFPALFYGILALDSLGNTLKDETIEKALLGLKSFHIMVSNSSDLDEIPFQDATTVDFNVVSEDLQKDAQVYQQCCISPVWDTAWAAVACLEAGEPSSNPELVQTARWLLSKQITDVVGDWAIKNPGVEPGGWSFEFKNTHYPDLDDTIEVLTLLYNIALPYKEVKVAIEKGVNWLVSMQCKNGGFAAFDKDNDLEILNKIPFSDHGACLDPATVDITGRVICFLVDVAGWDKDHPVIQRAADFILKNQEKDGSFWGRWGVNYLYGTWCALEALGTLGREKDKLAITRALNWLKSVQNSDGGYGEDCDSYMTGAYKKIPVSTASQTSWALMGYVGAGEANSPEAKKAADFLLKTQRQDGGWDEDYYTGTGFPGHFYIRYHGYRYFFPTLALAKYNKSR